MAAEVLLTAQLVGLQIPASQRNDATLSDKDLDLRRLMTMRVGQDLPITIVSTVYCAMEYGVVLLVYRR